MGIANHINQHERHIGPCSTFPASGCSLLLVLSLFFLVLIILCFLRVAVLYRVVLCCAASGSLLPGSSAHVHSLLEVASKLSEDGERPVIAIQTASSDILISHTDGYTTAIARASNFSRESFQPQQQEQLQQQPEENEQQQHQQQQQQEQ